MATYLKIENPGVCPVEGFILLGATSKRLADTDSPYTIGQFGSGNKHAVNVLLRAKLCPIVFCGNHKLEFAVKPGRMKALEGEASYNRVVVKHGGTDETGASVTYTEELSQTDEYGVLDWNCLGMAFREFVSNAIDAAIAVSPSKSPKDEDRANETARPQGEQSVPRGSTMGPLGWVIGRGLRIVVLTIRALLYTLVGDVSKWSEIVKFK